MAKPKFSDLLEAKSGDTFYESLVPGDTITMAENQRANTYDERLSSMAAMVNSNNQPFSVFEAYERARSEIRVDPTLETTKRAMRENVVGDVEADLDNVINEYISNGDIASASMGAVTAQEALDTVTTNAQTASIEELYLESQGRNFDERMRAEQLYQIETYGRLDTLLKGQNGLLDKMYNYSGLLLSDFTLDLSRVLGSDYLVTPDTWATFVGEWRSMPADVRNKLMPELIDAIQEATDENEVKTAIHVLDLLEDRPLADIAEDLRIDQAFLGLDLATLGAVVTTKIARLAKLSGNLSRTAKAIDNPEEAARISAMSLVDDTGQVQKATGTEPIVAHTNGTPFPNSSVLPEATDDISPDMERLLSSIKVTQDRVRKDLQDVASGEGFIRETAFTPTEKVRVQERAIKELEVMNEELAEQGKNLIEDIQVTKTTDSGFTLSYRHEGDIVRQEHDYTLSDLGTFDELPTGAGEKLITSPSYYLKGMGERIVEGATNIELAQAKITDKFNRAVQNVTRTTIGNPLVHKKQYQELDEVLLAGDDYVNPDGTFGTTFSIDDLKFKGIETKTQGTVRLNDKQIEAYYGLRELFDQAWVAKNNELRKTLSLNGFRDIQFEGLNVLGRPFSRPQDLTKSMQKNNVGVIYNPKANKGLGGVQNVADIDFSEMYKNGYRAVRFQQKQTIKGNKVSYGFVKDERITDLPRYVMHHKQGYVPKIYENGFYFVKEEIRGLVDSRPNRLVSLKTHRIFDNKKDAETYMDTLRAENPDGVYRTLHDRELNEAQLAEEAVGMSGGLYTSPRATKPPVFGLEGATPGRMSAFESLQRNINHLGNYLSRNEWRIGMQRKWINTARDMKMLDGNSFDGHLLGEPQTKQWNSLHASRNYLRDQMRIPTTEERWFEAKTRSMAEWAESPISLGGYRLAPAKLPKYARTSLQQLAQKDPFSMARSITFHSLLGWFNPAQLFVQAQGASIAISLNPTLAPGAIRQYMGLRPLVSLSKAGADPKTIRTVSDRLAKSIGVPKDDLWETYTLWNKTGLQESIRTTADLSAAAQNFGFGAGAFRDLAQKGLVFYREGEYFTRGIAFEIARKQWKKANPGKKIGDDELKAILDEAMKLQLNLTRANRAAWQKGALSIPTQFLQIQTKFIEKVWPNVLGGKGGLSGAQKMKLLSMQFAIYGGAGIPFGSWIVNEAMNFTGQTPEEMSPELKRYLDGGIWDTIFYSTFGADMQFGRRGAVVSGIEDFVKSAVYERAPMADSLFGAFGEIPTRTYKALGMVAPLVSNPTKIDWTLAEAGIIVNEMASVVSTWRSIDQAIKMNRDQVLYDKHGQIIIDRSLEGGFNKAEIVARGMGFQLKDVQSTYDLETINREWDKHIQKRADSLIQLQYNYANRVDQEGAGRNLEVMQQWLLGDLNDYEVQRVYDIVAQRLANNDSKEARAVNKFYRDVSDTVYEANPFAGGVFTNTIIPNVEEQEGIE